MSTIIDTFIDETGKTVTHTFVSELPELMPITEWVEKNKTTEELTIWNNATQGEHTPDSLALYREWLKTYQVVHTILRDDGSEIKNDHNTYEFE
jgi:hypothetical protein